MGNTNQLNVHTHQVLDLHYHPEEGQECFSGTLQQCEAWANTQSPRFMYSIVPMTQEEIEHLKR